MNKWLETWLVCLLSFLLAIALSNYHLQLTRTAAQRVAIDEVRGVWLTNIGSAVLFNPWGVDRALHQLSQLNFNTVYPVVWNRGNTLYPSQTAKQATGNIQDPFLNSFRLGRDVLAEIIQLGHHQGLRVIPWFEYGFMAPVHSELAQRHPNWVTSRRDGSQIIGNIEAQALPTADPTQTDSFIQTLLQNTRSSVQKALSTERVWLNPLHPEVQEFLLSMMAEVATHYAIEGIQLDDHFGLPVEFGYDPYTIALYQQEHDGMLPPNDPHDEAWMRWRADKLNQFMSRVFHTIKAINPACAVTLSPNSYSFAYRYYLQDWKTWVNQGWVEELTLQAYRDNLDAFVTELEQKEIENARKRIPVSVGIFSGSWGHPVPFSRISEQVEAVRSHQFAGVSFFYWESLWGYMTPESPQRRRSGFQTLFSSASTN
jgi:uncharacterized lipoprotein YddW (UPF0748 family)